MIKKKKTKIELEFAERSENMIAKGGYNAEVLASAFGVTRQTIENWAKKNMRFREAVLKGKERHKTEHPRDEKNREVEAALLKACLGHSWEEWKIENPGTSEEKKTVTSGYEAPSPSACVKWLENYDPVNWPGIQKVQHSGEIKGPPVLVIKKNYAPIEPPKIVENKENDGP